MSFLNEGYEQNDMSQYSPMYNQQQVVNPDVIRYRLESDDLIKQLEHDLKGEHFKDGKWIEGYGKWMNDEGLSVVISLVSRYNNRGCYLANLNPDQINYKCCNLRKELARLFFKKYDLYGIDVSKRSLLVRKIVDTAHLSLTRSEDGNEGKQISTTSNVNEIIHKDSSPPQNKVLGILPWGKGLTG